MIPIEILDHPAVCAALRSRSSALDSAPLLLLPHNQVVRRVEGWAGDDRRRITTGQRPSRLQPMVGALERIHDALGPLKTEPRRKQMILTVQLVSRSRGICMEVTEDSEKIAPPSRFVRVIIVGRDERQGRRSRPQHEGRPDLASRLSRPRLGYEPARQEHAHGQLIRRACRVPRGFRVACLSHFSLRYRSLAARALLESNESALRRKP